MSSFTDCPTCGAWAPAQCTCNSLPPPPPLSTPGSNWSFPPGSSHFFSTPTRASGFIPPTTTPGPSSAPSGPPPAAYRHDSGPPTHPSYPLHGAPSGPSYVYVAVLLLMLFLYSCELLVAMLSTHRPLGHRSTPGIYHHPSRARARSLVLIRLFFPVHRLKTRQLPL